MSSYSLKLPWEIKVCEVYCFIYLKSMMFLKLHLINFSKVLLWFSGERDVGTWDWKPLVLWIVGQNLLTPKKYIGSMCKRLWRHTIIFDWKCTEVNFRGNIDCMSLTSLLFLLSKFVLLILVRVWSDKNCHDYRELLGRLKQGITGPIYWRQKNPLNECATSPNFLFTHALPVVLASRRRCAPASCARY